MSCARDGVVDVGERDVRDRALAVIRQVDVTAALQRDAMLDQLKVSLASGRVQLDRAGVVDDAGERQDCTVANHQVASMLRHWV